MPKLLRTAVLFLVLFAVTNAAALEKFDFEQKFFVEFGPEVKDHSLLRVDGVYHLFYLRGNPAVNIGHATSPDLIHWDILDPVLYVEPGTWDEKALWAPQIFKLGSGWIMYYTGVNQPVAQQAGIAISPDLNRWFKLPNPVYHPDQSWALWSVDVFSHGRDPFVFEYGGMKYMLNTAKTPYNKGAISLAASSDGFNWTDEGPLYVHNTWHVLESLQMIERNGAYHMFYTEEAVNGTSWAMNTSGTPLANWDLTTGAVIDFGHAPEVNEFDPDVYTFSRHATTPLPGGGPQYVIRFDELKWTATYPYVNKPWALAGDWTRSGIAFVYSPTFLNNPAVRGESVDVGFEGNCWISSYEQYNGPLGTGGGGGYQGEGVTGTMTSRTFTVKGNSMSLLVGGTDSPDDCYVALRDAATNELLYKETGKNSDVLSPRVWDIRPYEDTDVYLEIIDNSAAGHIAVDNIEESYTIVSKTVKEGRGGGGRGHLDNLGVELPADVSLHQNSPNPFNPTTTINFELPSVAHVTIDIFDVSGQRIRRLLSRQEGPGLRSAIWDGRSDGGALASSGIYFYRLSVDGRNVATRKMILLK